MVSTKPARGTRDFLPAELRKREYVIGIIKEVYESYGFEPLETPAFENLETLTGKYGEEGNQLLFKIQKRRDAFSEELNKFSETVKNNAYDPNDTTANSLIEREFSDLGLRYDLTVPLARVVANNRNELPKFFKRYQIQPVWRADRPARGRFREFYQCDVDAIGSESMVVEAELVAAVNEILTKLGFKDFEIVLNHRGLLLSVLRYGFAWGSISEDKIDEVLVTLDKLDKIGKAGVATELQNKGLSEKSVGWLLAAFSTTEVSNSTEMKNGWLSNLLNLEHVSAFIGGQWELYDDQESMLSRFREANDNSIAELGEFLSSGYDEKKRQHILTLVEGNEVATKAVDEIYKLLTLAKNHRLRFVASLARGLSYYTGTIMEIVLTDGDFKGSIGGGGRYDGLIGMFGKEQIPACGFSLGLERILVVMEERGMFPPEIADSKPADAMVTIWSEDTIAESLKLASELRSKNIRVTVYPQPDKFAKQMKYADQIKVPFACVLGESEIAEGKVTVKNMKTGEQETISRNEAAAKIKS